MEKEGERDTYAQVIITVRCEENRIRTCEDLA